MKIKFYTTVILLFCCIAAWGQMNAWQWAKGVGGIYNDQGFGITKDGGGNIYVTGTFSLTVTFGSVTLTGTGNSSDVFIVKYDASGNVIWVKSAGGINNDVGRSISTDIFGNAFITGFFSSPSIIFGNDTLINAGSASIFVAAYNASGTELWARGAGGNGVSADIGYGISTELIGNSYVTGIFTSNSITFGSTTLINNGNQDVFIVKYDGAGNVVWAKQAGYSSYDYGVGIGVDVSGNSYTTGYFWSDSIAFGNTTLMNPGAVNVFTVKHDPSGNVIWAKCAGGVSGFSGLWANAISVDGNGNAYITGSLGATGITFGSFTLSTAGLDDIFAVKYDPAGNVIWARRAGGSSADVGYGISSDIAGNCYVAGYFWGPTITFGGFTLTGSGLRDIFVTKYDVTGNVLWANSASGPYNDWPQGITTDGSGNSYITGWFHSDTVAFGNFIIPNSAPDSTAFDIFIAKLDNTTGIAEKSNFNHQPAIFPNPGNGEIKISYPENIDEIDIRNVTGQIIYASKPGVRTVFLKPCYDAGVYFVTVRSGDRVVTRKWVRER